MTRARSAPAMLAVRAYVPGDFGFVPVAFGVSPAPESEPDVEYRWLPGGLS